MCSKVIHGSLTGQVYKCYSNQEEYSRKVNMVAMLVLIGIAIFGMSVAPLASIPFYVFLAVGLCAVIGMVAYARLQIPTKFTLEFKPQKGIDYCRKMSNDVAIPQYQKECNRMLHYLPEDRTEVLRQICAKTFEGNLDEVDFRLATSILSEHVRDPVAFCNAVRNSSCSNRDWIIDTYLALRMEEMDRYLRSLARRPWRLLPFFAQQNFADFISQPLMETIYPIDKYTIRSAFQGEAEGAFHIYVKEGELFLTIIQRLEKRDNENLDEVMCHMIAKSVVNVTKGTATLVCEEMPTLPPPIITYI